MQLEKSLHMVAYVLLFVGGVNWGLVGLLDMNVVSMVLGSMAGLEKIVYILVGVSAVYLMATHMTYCKYCGKK